MREKLKASEHVNRDSMPGQWKTDACQQDQRSHELPCGKSTHLCFSHICLDYPPLGGSV